MTHYAQNPNHPDHYDYFRTCTVCNQLTQECFVFDGSEHTMYACSEEHRDKLMALHFPDMTWDDLCREPNEDYNPDEPDSREFFDSEYFYWTDFYN